MTSESALKVAGTETTGGQVSQRADIWSLKECSKPVVTSFTLCSGRHAHGCRFTANNQRRPLFPICNQQLRISAGLAVEAAKDLIWSFKTEARLEKRIFFLHPSGHDLLFLFATKMFLNTVLVVLTDLAARLLGNKLFRQHFHLLLSAVLVFGPALSLWVSHHSIFAKRSHFLYRLFLRSGWGWTCVFVGSFIFLFSFSIRRSVLLSLRHLSRLAVGGGLWLCFCTLLDLLENTTGSCYEPLPAGPEVTGGQPLLVLKEGESKSECLKAGMVWRGYEVSEDVFLLCLCCLLLAEETSVFGPYLRLGGVSDAPLRILFLLCVLLLGLWIFLLLCLLAYFPQFPTQLLGGALGCLSWRGLYQGWYRMGPSWYCPGRPGQGLLNIKTSSTGLEDTLNHNHYN